MADKLETQVWEKIEAVLNNPEFITTAIEKQCDATNDIGALESELQQVERQLRAADHDQKQLLQWALKGFPEETVIAENKRINETRRNLQSQKAELELQIKASHEASISLPKLEAYIQLIRGKLTTLDFDMKRLALEMLNIKVWVDDLDIEITGSVPVEDVAIVSTSSSRCGHNHRNMYQFKLAIDTRIS